jgi:adenine/guanine/hypoxanthine permease
MDAIASYFKFAERGTSIGTEARAGLTTFMVMAYIIFLNPSILMGGFEASGDARFTLVALSAGTALIAGIMTIAMGVIGNMPFMTASASTASWRSR